MTSRLPMGKSFRVSCRIMACYGLHDNLLESHPKMQLFQKSHRKLYLWERSLFVTPGLHEFDGGMEGSVIFCLAGRWWLYELERGPLVCNFF